MNKLYKLIKSDNKLTEIYFKPINWIKRTKKETIYACNGHTPNGVD
jgi:hypothetical protein